MTDKPGPKLLSGGNPQIPKGDGDAPVQAYIAAMPGWKRDLGRRLDALIVDAVPGVRKAVKWNSPFYGAGDEGWFLSWHCFDRYVKVAFFRGTSLDPLAAGRIEAEGGALPARPRGRRPRRGPVRRLGEAGERAAGRTDVSARQTMTTEDASPSRLIDARIAELGDWRGATLARVRALIREADPEVVEEWKWRGVPVWSHAGIVCTGETYRDKVKLTFAKGAALADPSGLFNASLDGTTRRAIDLAEGDAIDAEALKALVRAAVALNTSTAGRARQPRLGPRPDRWCRQIELTPYANLRDVRAEMARRHFHLI